MVGCVCEDGGGLDGLSRFLLVYFYLCIYFTADIVIIKEIQLGFFGNTSDFFFFSGLEWSLPIPFRKRMLCHGFVLFFDV